MVDDEVREALQRSSVRRLREVFEDREDVLLGIVDRDRVIRWASPVGARAVFGRGPQAWMGTRMDDYVHPDDLPTLLAGMERALTGETASWEVRASASDAPWVRTRNTAWLVDPEGGLVIILTVPAAAGT